MHSVIIGSLIITKYYRCQVPDADSRRCTLGFYQIEDIGKILGSVFESVLFQIYHSSPS